MSTIYYLYVKTHNITGKKYLGQTTKNPYEYKGSGKLWLRHLKKYGYDVSTELIAAFDGLEDLAVAGLFWSQKWNIVESNEWANLRDEGGDGAPKGNKLSETTKKKIGLSNTGYKHSEETKKKLSLFRIGNKYSLGHKHSEETKLKMSLAKKGKPKSEETKLKMSLASKGKKCPWLIKRNKLGHTEETKKKLRLINLGKKHSEETKLKMSLAQKGQLPWNTGIRGYKLNRRRGWSTPTIGEGVHIVC